MEQIPARAIVTAGGRSHRLGGSPKALLRDAQGRSLVERTVDGLLACGVPADGVVVVGPADLPVRDVLVTREDPPYGGPAAALAAGQRALDAQAPDAPWTLALACDMPAAARIAAALREAAAQAAPRVRGIVLREDGRDQPLAAVYRTPALRLALQEPTQDRSVRAVLSGLWDAAVDVQGLTADADTWEDVERLSLREDR